MAEPQKPKVDLNRTHNNINIIALVLTLHISYANTTRKTAHIRNIPISYQTVLNYIQTVAYYCHQFNLKHKGEPDDIFLRPHTALNYKTPIQLPELDGFDLIRNKWVEIISLAA